MWTNKLLSASILLLLVAHSVIPQAAADAAKRRKELDEKALQMLEQTIGEANSLKLPQNRAVVYSMLGDLFWRYDSKRSKELFRSAGAEINNYYMDVEKERRENADKLPEIFDPMDVRAEVLNLISIRDPEIAYELLLQTRPPEVAEAMARVNPAGADLSSRSGMENARALQEIASEDRFSTMAASRDPEKAAAALKASLAKGISGNMMQLLQAVHRADEKKAADLSATVVSRIGELDLTRSASDLNSVISILQIASRPLPKTPVAVKIFSFTETQIKDIANKLSSTFLSTAPSGTLTPALTRALPLLEKNLPEKALLLRQRDAANKKAANANRRGAQGVFDPNASLEDILAQAAKLPNERDRTAAYQNVSSRLSQVTDEPRAKKIIEQIGDERIRKAASEQFEAARASRLIAADKLEEAKRVISALPNRHVRTQRLVSLALQFANKKAETDMDAARALMSEAKGLTNTDPQDEDDIADVMELVRGYSVLDPDNAFRLVEPIADQFNEITNASAVLSKYNKRDRSFKNGELLIRVNGNPGGALMPFRYLPHYQMLGRIDIEKTASLADRFTRSDARILIRLNALQGYSRSAPPVAR